MLVSEALALIKSQGGFDPSVAQTSDTMIRSWLSAAVQEAVAQAKWLKQVRQLGPTVAGTAQYDVDEDVVDLAMLRVGTSRPYARATLEEMWVAEADGYRFVQTSGAFAPAWETEDAQDVDDVPRQFKLLPVPGTSGLPIEALCVVNHKPITAATPDTYKLQLPEDLARAIAVDGAVSMGILYVNERADLAAPYGARYDVGKAELKRRGNSQIGSGVRYVRVRGR